MRAEMTKAIECWENEGGRTVELPVVARSDKSAVIDKISTFIRRQRSHRAAQNDPGDYEIYCHAGHVHERGNKGG